MKIFEVTTFFHPVVGGVETHVDNLAREIQNAGHEVTVLCSDSGKSGPRIKDKIDSISGIPIRRFFNFFSLSYFHKFYPGLFFYLLRNDWDIVHVHGFRKIETYFALFAAKIKKKKIILTTHNPFPTTSRSRRMKLFVKLHDLTFGKLFTRYLDKIIILVNSEKKILIKNFHVSAKQIVLIPNGISKEFFIAGNKEKFFKDWNINKQKFSHLIAAVGRISFTKGFQYLNQAIQEHSEILFVFAGGDDGYLKYLKQKFSTFNNVFFTERYLPQDKLIDLYAASDLFVFPSIHEPFGIVLLEALAAGIPVICSNQGGPKEFIPDNLVEFIKPEVEANWSNSITKLLSNQTKLHKVSKSGKVFASQFLWEKVGIQIIQQYSKLLHIK
ncbi:MAG: glycosyltransferase family 4 protein [bacterium]